MVDGAATGEWPPAEAGPADQPTVAGYVILGELGRGGMGVVYKAQQLSQDRSVALKLLRDGALAGPQERARFRTEAEASASLRHPNVVEIYEVGECRGQPYLAMELVGGGSLDRRIDDRPQPAVEAAELIRTLAHAVQHAHSRNIIHRDLKPANVLLASGGGNAPGQLPGALPPPLAGLVPKITDFGLAKRLDSDSTAWTQDGAVLGTAGYMAPEQAAGHAREVGPAADVYSLGAILYELLTGRPPFRADTWRETVEQVLRDEPVPPTRAHANVPRDLETVCLKCLEKDPARRYASAGELADDVTRFLVGQPVAAVPPNDFERLARLAARDGYELTGEVGRGPRSTVYRALTGPLRQPVAVKVFTAGVGTREEWEARQRQVTDLWAAVIHPHVVRVQGAGWWDGTPYVTTEYAPHGNLTATFTGRPTRVREVLRLVEPLAEIVCYLHRQGVVHGNLKPANVLLAADGIPRVCDARVTNGLLPAGDAEPAGLGYLPPEFVRDPTAESRPTADVYGLGLILYELLTGRLPFTGPSASEVLEQVRGHDPDPPSQFNREVSPQLDAVCLRCLRKNPWHRYTRAYDLLSRLRSAQNAPPGRQNP